MPAAGCRPSRSRTADATLTRGRPAMKRTPLLFFSLLLTACGESEPSAPASQPVGAGATPIASPAPVDPKDLDRRDDPVLRRIEFEDETLFVDILHEGAGPVARPGDELAVYFEGRLESAEDPFVTTRGLWLPARWVLDERSDARPVEGLRRAMLGLARGTRARVHVPGHLAYGQTGVPGSGIEAHADLIFDVLISEVRACEH